MKVAVFLLYMLKSINQSHGFLLSSCFLDNYGFGFVIAKAKVNTRLYIQVHTVNKNTRLKHEHKYCRNMFKPSALKIDMFREFVR